MLDTGCLPQSLTRKRELHVKSPKRRTQTRIRQLCALCVVSKAPSLVLSVVEKKLEVNCSHEDCTYTKLFLCDFVLFFTFTLHMLGGRNSCKSATQQEKRQQVAECHC